MSLAKVKTEITYKVPAWGHCNLQGSIFGQPSAEKCRFCVKEKGYYRCALYNTVLSTSNGAYVDKTRACQRATAGYASVVEEEEVPQVEPKKLIKSTIAEYNKVRKQLINQGYPDVMAEKLAAEYLIGGR